ncbi:MAG: DUF4405 domain-containing protein [Defluviimonas denitrificans]
MPSLVSRYATPLITGLFLVSLVSGIALFFHVGGAAFHGMHEWLSMVLIVPFALHIWKNWKPMTAYLKRMPMALSLALSVVAAAVFFLPTGGEAGAAGRRSSGWRRRFCRPRRPPPRRFGMSEPDFVAGLKDAGLVATGTGQTLRDMAAAAGKTDAELAATLLQFGS